MGNREDLLAGAKECLYRQGYRRPTSRDIAAAAGVSMGAISYHFGSREALLGVALVDATQAWGAEVRAALAEGTADAGRDGDPFERTWSSVLASLTRHRALWAAVLDAFTQPDHTPEVRRELVAALTQARFGLAELFGMDGLTRDDSWAVGSLLQALLTGLALQRLVDPDHALDAAEIVRGFQLVEGTTSRRWGQAELDEHQCRHPGRSDTEVH